MEAVVFCGIQGSGKTTFYRERLLPTHVRISLDLLRTRHRERAFLSTCIETRQPFAVDNTNPTAVERRVYLEPALAAGFRATAYFFDVRPEEAIERNERRGGGERIPIAGLLGTYKRLEPPRHAEGFTRIVRVRAAAEGGWLVEELPDEPAPAKTRPPAQPPG